MRFTARIPLTGDHTKFSSEAVAGLVGQRPMIRGFNSAQGEVVAAELSKDGDTVTLVLEVAEGVTLAYDHNTCTMSGVMTMGDSTIVGFNALDIFPDHREAVPAQPSYPLLDPPRYMFVDYLRVAIADPGSVIGERLGRAEYGEAETIANWGARAAIVVVNERDRLRRDLACTQCGYPLERRACGPTHAMMSFDPWLHKDAPVWDRQQR